MNALALEQVVDRCGDLGEVSIDPSMANPQARSLLIAINVDRNSLSLYTISVERLAGVSFGQRMQQPIDAIILTFLIQAV